MGSYSGIWVALITPFHQGEIDVAALRDLARHIAGTGVSGLVVCGTTGEAAALTDDEQLMVLDVVCDAVPHCPVVMGLATNNMATALQRQQQYQRRKIAGLLVTPPYYIRPSQAGIIDYFEQIANAAAVPMILYNIPYRTGVDMTLDTIRTLAQHERIVAIKDCGGNAAITMQLIADRQLAVLAGEDLHIFSTLCLGGAGAITAAAHVRPDLYVRLANYLQAGQLEQARAVCYALQPLQRLLFQEPNPALIKAALALQGRLSDELRAPLQVATDVWRTQLAAEMRRLDEQYQEIPSLPV